MIPIFVSNIDDKIACRYLSLISNIVIDIVALASAIRNINIFIVIGLLIS